MNLESLAYLAQIVTAVLVAVSLIYLGTQVRQNAKAQQAENYARALDRVAAMQARLSENQELTSIFTRAIVDPNTISPVERVQVTWGLYELFGAMEFMYHQYRDGMLPAAVWKRWEVTLAWWLGFPGVRAWWSVHPTPFSDELNDLVDRLLAEPPARNDASARWDEFLRGPGARRQHVDAGRAETAPEIASPGLPRPPKLDNVS